MTYNKIYYFIVNN